MNRKLLWAVLAVGLVLVVAPFALGMPGKTAAGQSAGLIGLASGGQRFGRIEDSTETA